MKLGTKVILLIQSDDLKIICKVLKCYWSYNNMVNQHPKIFSEITYKTDNAQIEKLLNSLSKDYSNM